MSERWLFCLVAACCLNVMGCSRGTEKELGTVSGVVTIGGKPTANIQVQFSPAAGGRTSVGVTDGSGRYELTYDGDNMGAEVGKHTVTLAAQADAPSDDTMDLNKSNNPIPSKHRDAKLDFEVKSGSNTFDITLD